LLQRELDAGRPPVSGNKKPIRAASVIHHLCNTLQLLRIHAVTGAVTRMDAGNRRVAKAQEAAERLLAKRLHTQDQCGVSIEPASWEGKAQVGEQLHQTFTIKVADSLAGPVKLRGLQLIKHRGTGAGSSGLCLDRGLQLPADLIPGSEFDVEIWSRPDKLGMLSDVAVFIFEQSAVRFSICRFVSVRVGDPDAEELLKPSTPYARKRRVPMPRKAPVVDGRPPSGSGMVPYKIELKQYEIPGSFRFAMEKANHVAEKKLSELWCEVALAEGIQIECPETYQKHRQLRKELQQVYTSKLSVGGFSLLNTACRQCEKHRSEHHSITSTRTRQTFLFCNDPRRQVAHAKCASYSLLYSHLLWAEERAMEIDIRAFDIAADPGIKLEKVTFNVLM
jgi:hypothetical protein